jgi:hypothetical protein
MRVFKHGKLIEMQNLLVCKTSKAAVLLLA